MVKFILWLTLRRARASWRMMTALALGVLLAVTLVSVATLHSRSLAEAGLGYALDTSPSLETRTILMMIQDRPVGRQDYDRLRQSVDEAIQTHIGWLFHGMHRGGRSQVLPFVATADETPPRLGADMAYLFFQGGFQEHARLVTGRWPQPIANASDEGRLSIEVVLGAEAAGYMNWSKDERVFLVPFATAPEEKVAVTIVGIVEPIDPEDEYWFRDLSRFRVAADADVARVPLYAGDDTFFNGIGTRYPMLLANYSWYVFMDLGPLTATTASQALDSLEVLEADINRAYPRSWVLTLLNKVIAEYQRDLTLARVPLILFTSLVVGVVLYYLVLITVMLARDRGAEAALIRSRGTTVPQVVALLGLGEGLAIVVPAVLVGPFLGWSLARVLPTGYAVVGHHVGLSPSIFFIAAVVGLICMLVLLAAATAMAGRSIVQFLREQGRPPDRPAVYRYAIDVLVLAALGLIWWQIRGRGGFVTEQLLGEGLEIDPSLLLGPALALLAVGLLLLRLLPWMLRLLARLVGPFGPTWLVHALRRMTRDHIAYGTLAVLLMFATALGIFGATFGETLTRSSGDQVRYSVGGEMAVLLPPTRLYGYSTEQPKALATLPGVRIATPVYRDTLVRGKSTQRSANYSLLAVDPANLISLTWFREEFAGKSLADLMRPLLQRLPPDRALPLPQGTESIGVWVRPLDAYIGYNVYIRMRDSAGQYDTVPLGNLGVYSWTYLETPVPDSPRLQPPYNLVGIFISGLPLSGIGSGSIALDDVTAVVEGKPQVVEGFESAGPWTMLPNQGSPPPTLTFEGEAAHSGGSGALYSWTEPNRSGPWGLFVPPAPMPIPAIGSSSFSPGQELVARLENQPVALQVQDVTEHFPTLYPNIRPFLVVNLEHLDRYLHILPFIGRPNPTEFWVALEEGADSDQTVEAILDPLPLYTYVRDREELAIQAQSNPLTGGAWNGLALVAAITLGTIAILSLAIYASLAVKRARLELGVLQALGLSRWRVGMVLALEGLIVAIVGLGLGTVMGGWLGRWAVSYQGITAEGRSVVPPLELALDGRLAALTYVEVTLAAVVAIMLAVALTVRLRLHEVLRVEE